MKAMESSMEEEECIIETVSSTKKKKMKQAQLPFQTLSSSKSSDTQQDIHMKKKRKLASPMVEAVKKSKVMKLSTKENSAKNDSQDKREDLEEKNPDDINKLNVSEVMEEEQGKEKKRSTRQTQESKKEHPKRRDFFLRKRSKIQQESGAITLKQFLKVPSKKKTERSAESSDLCRFPRQNPSSDAIVLSSDNEAMSEVDNSTLSERESKVLRNEPVSAVDIVTLPLCHKRKKVKDVTSITLDSSSENEAPAELETSTLSTSGRVTDESTSVVTPTSDRKKKKPLTPKQLQKEQEIARRREEKLKLREERRQQQEVEKANRRRQREERQREKEEKERMEREEKKREKELKELRKQMEIEQKQKEKEAREEERRKREEAKVEEKRKKEEEKLEAERKKQKAASNFASYFVASKKQGTGKWEEDLAAIETNFMPFEVKADMRVAPVNRRTITAEEKLYLDQNFDTRSLSHNLLYLENVRHGRHVPKKSHKTWPSSWQKDDEVVLLDEDNDGTTNHNNIIMHNLEKRRPKLLQFCENRRPPYWGTWRKRSNVVTPKRPFSKDKELFDYTVDSDDEWEEEEPGESLKGSDDEKDDENSEENEYDVDNEFMVPHGYLSDEEAQTAEDEEDISPQTQKMKLKMLGEQFEAEMNTKTQKLRPKLIGCIWQRSDNTLPESTPPKIKELLLARQAWVSGVPVTLPSAESKAQTPQQTSAREKTKSFKKTKLAGNETGSLPDVLQLLHGKNIGRKRVSAKKTKKSNESAETTKQQRTAQNDPSSN